TIGRAAADTGTRPTPVIGVAALLGALAVGTAALLGLRRRSRLTPASR
ncbi:MAG: hypothetical protein HW413_878, partial [Thermoleophilia bacterium]|nr:hypothetical protein [Thermoleophilia bacterium]